ncbi:TIGR02677 family protein [Streptomyces sp. NPDC058001]|uniref:TIGR02677 family protein n=1 Tax=Streptomyces sp. NPDC058001 TaxID=3346300 RepID=UPI0036E88F3B
MTAQTPGPDPADSGPFYGPFAHLTTPNAPLYRQVMGTFLVAKERFAVHLRPEDVHASLEADRRAGLESVVKALDNLVTWGNLRADPDTARVTAVEDFYRKRFIYQLTRAGEAAEAALGMYDEVLGRRGELQAVALHDIVTQLRALLVIAAEDEPDSAKAYVALSVLTARFTDLADNARAFMGSLQRTIDLHDIEVEAFLAYKDLLIQYLERFIQDLITLGGRIALLIGELEEQGRVGPLLRLAAARDAADAAPEEAERAEATAYRKWAARWSGLAQWFVSAEGRESQARLLRGRALGAIPQLLAVVRQLNERRAGRSDRSADFRELARWFARAPDDEARHRLWRVGFGLYSSRHLTVDADTLDERTARPESASTSWAAARPLWISPQLRRTGSYERRGKPRRVADRGEAKRRLAEIAARQAEQAATAQVRLATGGPVRLSRLGELDPLAFELFLRLLGDALATWRPGMRTTVAGSGDGSMEIRLTALDDGSTAELRTPHGVFSGPDHLVDIIDLAQGSGATRFPGPASAQAGSGPEADGAEAEGPDAATGTAFAAAESAPEPVRGLIPQQGAHLRPVPVSPRPASSQVSQISQDSGAAKEDR